MKQMVGAFLCIAAAAFSVVPIGALGQIYPNKPVRVIIPFPPGGGVDLTARLFQQNLSASLGQPVIIDNRGGAAGSIGEDFVAHSAPDGYTILYTVGSDMTMKKFLSKTFTLDPLKDLTPIATAVGSVSCILASASLPVNSIKEMVDYAKRNPGKLTYGSAGIASAQHLAGELLRMQGVDLVHVPFKGMGPALTALVGGQIDLAISNFATAMPSLRDGKIRVLAVTDSKRYDLVAEVPSVSEALPGFNMPPAWFGFFGPPRLPQPIVSRLSAEIAKAREAPEVNSRLRESYVIPITVPLEQLPAFILGTMETYSRIVKAAGIQAE